MAQKELTEYAARLEEVKVRFKLKNTDLAKITGYSDNAISKLMNGLTEAPDVRLLASVAKKFNISGDWILFGEGPMIKEEQEVSSDSSLKKGLQMRDEFISQLQKELWGKSEGAIEMPLSSNSEFEHIMREYRGSVYSQPELAHYLFNPVEQKLVAPRSLH